MENQVFDALNKVPSEASVNTRTRKFEFLGQGKNSKPYSGNHLV